MKLLGCLSLVALVLAASVAPAASKGGPNKQPPPVQDNVGAMVVANNGNPNSSYQCTSADDDALQAYFMGVVLDAAADYSARRRELTGSEGMPEHHGRKLGFCGSHCGGFPPGHCHLAWPRCTGWRRGLDEEHMKDDQEPIENAITPTNNLRGERKLTQWEGYWLDPNNFWDFYNTNPSDMAANDYCAYLKPIMEQAANYVADTVTLSSSCQNLYQIHAEVGCVYIW